MNKVLCILLLFTTFLSCGNSNSSIQNKSKEPTLIESIPLTYKTVKGEVDGIKLDQVNLWSLPNKNRKYVGTCSTKTKVEVLEYTDPYVKIKTEDGVIGWLMQDFLEE